MPVHRDTPSASRDPFATGEMGVPAILRAAFGSRFVGVLVRGDAVAIDGREVGTVVGFDECHFSKHLNIVLQAADARTGIQLGLRPGALLQIRPRSGNHLADIPADTD
ncbi:MAG: hypothetical protein WCS09_17635 [Pseudomonadota bacterium]|jgi:hypothetical protein